MIQNWLGKQLRQPNGLLSKWIGRYMERGNYEINSWTLNLLDVKESDVLLEVGIGNGSTLNRIVKSVSIRKIYGVDISEDMIREARKLNKRYIENGKAVLQKADISSLPFSGSVFDKVFTVHTIYFWSDINQGFREIYRVLKPKGKLYLSILDKSKMEKMQRTRTFNLLSLEEIEHVLIKNSFNIIRVHKKGSYWCIEVGK
ncbi:hypothetical protein Q75_01700 [Bacillus coahuilensis p1.1.43]|uniref:Methyltransferase type 11 domain-containing protein n=1 Tax=Bacillus coahuilensis p1.1.43 TaxID=1150625 RepID=A0A147KBU2_9BACI|nr:class I SAM-dependent methyltransferase [Bacillus coahuilensis]KUP08952.1 hypothetical protein Q75_01700 [Bacillus coahuilensis p1.1.43]